MNGAVSVAVPLGAARRIEGVELRIKYHRFCW